MKWGKGRVDCFVCVFVQCFGYILRVIYIVESFIDNSCVLVPHHSYRSARRPGKDLVSNNMSTETVLIDREKEEEIAK